MTNFRALTWIKRHPLPKERVASLQACDLEREIGREGDRQCHREHDGDHEQHVANCRNARRGVSVDEMRRPTGRSRGAEGERGRGFHSSHSLVGKMGGGPIGNRDGAADGRIGIV